MINFCWEGVPDATFLAKFSWCIGLSARLLELSPPGQAIEGKKNQSERRQREGEREGGEKKREERGERRKGKRKQEV